jgi:predicted permease
MGWLHQLFSRRRHYRELSESIREHLEEKIADLMDRGLNRKEAERTARREFGNVTRIEERSREVWQWPTLESILADLRYTLRQFYRAPSFAVTAIAVCALGIGASTGIFAFVDAALIKPLPYADPQRLVKVTESDTAVPHVNISYLDYLDWKKQNTVLSSMEVFSGWSFLLSTPTGTEPVPAVRVSSGFFRTLGIAPALGRDFNAKEETPGGPNVVMLSYGIWERSFGLRKDVIGSSVKLSGVSYSVIGVLPRGFEFALANRAEYWTPLQPTSDCEKLRDCHNLYAVGRLKDGVTVSAALANMESIAQQLERQYPDTNRDRGASVVLLSEAIVGEIRPILLLVLGGAGLLLLIACVNVSSLLIVHFESRKREIAVRGALGASRTRIASQLITEGIVLVMGGALAGVALADGAVQVLSRLLSKQMLSRMPFLEGVRLNAQVVGFAVIVTLLAAALFAVTLIVHLLSCDVREGLTDGGRTAAGTLWRRLGGRLVVIELATAMVLLTGAGLLGQSLYRLLHVDVGFPADHLAWINVRMPELAFHTDAQQAEFARRVLDRVKHLPGVRAVGLTSQLPVTCSCNSDWVRIVGRPYDGGHITVSERHVSGGFFGTLHTRLLAGRYFTDAEDASKPRVVMINHTFAQKYFAGEDPVGKRIGDPTLSASSIKRIVGVIEDFMDGALDEEQMPAEYIPFSQAPNQGFDLMVRTGQVEETILPAITAAIRELNRDVGIEQGSSLTKMINDSQTATFHRSTAYLVGGFAALALILSAVGLYGVIAYSVSQRTREIGVRMALGAQRSAVYGLVMRQAGWLTVTGLALGLAGAVGVATLIRKMLFGVAAWDAATLAAVAALLGAAAMAASFVPARRAASVNPVEALRSE